MAVAAAQRAFTIREIATQLRALGVRADGVLLVHCSYRAVRPVAGGPDGLIEALFAAVGSKGTLVMPSWSGSDDEPFDPACSSCEPDLGIVAERFRQRPGVRRADHSFSFAANGPLAARILRDPLPLPPHRPESPVGRVHEEDGQVLLLGCGHDANTTMHLAEILAGVPYRVPKHMTVLREGELVRTEYGENDHCCARFALADGWLRAAGLQAEGRIGNSHARLFRSRDIVQLASTELARDPLLFLHAADAGCAECDRARASVDLR